jgi:type IV secretion system protein VirB4
MAIYEAYDTRAHTRPAYLSDAIPWRGVAAPGVLLHKKRHGLQRSYAMRGPDVDGESREHQGALALQANEAFKHLGGRWMIQTEAQRGRVWRLPRRRSASPVANLLEQTHHDHLLADPGCRETQYYLTLTWWPMEAATRQALGFLVSGPGTSRHAGQDAVQLLKDFRQQADYLTELLKGVLAICRPLTMGETFTYLHNCVSHEWHEVGDLAVYTDIDQQLCTSPFAGGWYPLLGDPLDPTAWHLRTCSLVGYPAESMVGITRTLEAAQVDFRWCTRWIGMEKQVQSGMLTRTQHAWVNKERSFLTRNVESFSGREVRVIDSDATNKALDADAARQEIGADLIAFGHFTKTVTVWDPDPDQAEAKLTLVRQALASRGFTTTAERQHATAALLSTIPGNSEDNVRKTGQHSLTLAHLCPGLTAAWPGPERDEYLNAGPWFYGLSAGRTLVRIVNHIRDLGHFLVPGPTRSGKSTLGNFLRLMWMLYANAQAKLFDLDGHGRLLTYLLGGQWYDLGATGTRLQPFRRIDDEAYRHRILEWLLELLEDFGLPRDARTVSYVGSNLRKLAKYPPAQRTMSQLITLMAEGSRESELRAKAGRIDAQGISHPDPDLKALVVLATNIRMVLKQFTDEGEFGGIFDGTEDLLQAQPVETFELRTLLSRPRMMGAVLRYVLLHTDLQMTTDHPMLLLLDDAAITWMADDNQRQTQQGLMRAARREEKVKEWLMTTAKKAVSVGFMTHSLEQVFNSVLGVLLTEACPSRFYMPNPSALEPNIRRIYEAMGLADTAILQVATARPQRDIYYSCRETGQIKFSLPLPPLILNCVARNRADDHALMDRLMQQEGREGFAPAWLRHCGFAKEADDVAAALRGRTSDPGRAASEETWDALVGTAVD